jgi:hypothetical protein
MDSKNEVELVHLKKLARQRTVADLYKNCFFLNIKMVGSIRF